MEKCLLCGKSCTLGKGQPGLPALCDIHEWRNLKDCETFSEEEAHEAGKKRVSILSLKEREDEKKIVQQQLAEYQANMPADHLKPLFEHYMRIAKAMEAYLSAFE